MSGNRLAAKTHRADAGTGARLCTLFAYGTSCYDLYTVAEDLARMVTEQALRERFLPFLRCVSRADARLHRERAGRCPGDAYAPGLAGTAGHS